MPYTPIEDSEEARDELRRMSRQAFRRSDEVSEMFRRVSEDTIDFEEIFFPEEFEEKKRLAGGPYGSNGCYMEADGISSEDYGRFTREILDRSRAMVDCWDGPRAIVVNPEDTAPTVATRGATQQKSSSRIDDSKLGIGTEIVVVIGDRINPRSGDLSPVPMYPDFDPAVDGKPSMRFIDVRDNPYVLSPGQKWTAKILSVRSQCRQNAQGREMVTVTVRLIRSIRKKLPAEIGKTGAAPQPRLRVVNENPD